MNPRVMAFLLLPFVILGIGFGIVLGKSSSYRWPVFRHCRDPSTLQVMMGHVAFSGGTPG